MSESYLEQLHATLQRIADLVPTTLADWQADEVRRLAIERLWITAGNLADAHRLATGVDAGSDHGPNCIASAASSRTHSPATCPMSASGTRASRTYLD